ncbi:MAG TPA: hypothetical protein V6D08_02665 [Candidatus Obscuribacterales bacterium]
MEQGINEARLEVLERRALGEDNAFVSAALNSLSLEERLKYARAMQKDFDRLNALDPAFPTLQIVSRSVAGRQELSDIVLTRMVPAVERITKPAYWFSPAVRHSLYDASVPPLFSRKESNPVRRANPLDR